MTHEVRLPIPEMLTAQLGVYCAPSGEPPDPMSVVLAGLEARATGRMRDALGAFFAKSLLRARVLPRAKLPDPPTNLLRGMRAGPEEMKRFEGASHVILVQASYLPAPPPFHHWSTLAAAGALAERMDGTVLDPLFPRLLPLDERTCVIPENGLVTVVRDILAPMSTQGDGTVLITTKGMTRFGIPELRLAGIPPGVGGDALPLVNAVAQRLLHELYRRASQGRLSVLVLEDELSINGHDMAAAWGRRLEEDGPGGTAMVRLSYAEAKNGLEPFVDIEPPRAFRGQRGEWVYAALEALTRQESPSQIVHRKTGDAALREATERARSEVPAVRERFARGLELGARLYVKRGFPVRDFKEFMWVAVTRWENARVHGALANSSGYDARLRAGHAVDFADGEVTDWMIRHDDGRTEGGHSIAALSQ